MAQSVISDTEFVKELRDLALFRNDYGSSNKYLQNLDASRYSDAQLVALVRFFWRARPDLPYYDTFVRLVQSVLREHELEADAQHLDRLLE